MRYEKASELKDRDFKRLCGVKKEKFVLICEIVKESVGRETRDRKAGLATEDQIWLTLGYWREYQTRVSSEAGFRSVGIECLAGDSESRRYFNQVREVFAAE